MKTKKANTNKMEIGTDRVATEKPTKKMLPQEVNDEADNNHVSFTKDEYSALMDAYFQINSVVRVIGQACNENDGFECQELNMDTANILAMAGDKLEIMGTLLCK